MAVAVSAVVCLVFLIVSPAVAVPPLDLSARPRATATVDALLLWRDGLPGRPLYLDINEPSVVALDAADITPGMAAGPRYRIDLSPSGDGAWEFNYFNVETFTGSRSIASSDGQSAFGQNNIFEYGLPDVISAEAASTSAIQSFELNRRASLARFDGDFLVGFRWVEWNDRLTIRDRTFSGTATGSDLFIANTFDSLYGAQMGLDMVLLGSRERAWVEGLGKAGIYYNNASQNSFAESISALRFTRSTSASADLTSFFGELGFTGCVRLSEHWTARAGFTMFWLANGTAAADQLSVNNLFSGEIESGIANGDTVFLYGLNLGLQAAW